MTQQVTITIADKVYDEINTILISQKKTNRSELIEELIRDGLKTYLKEVQ
jgi:metal-responsive CopG/Arc/MetJ family transcriptional regulator